MTAPSPPETKKGSLAVRLIGAALAVIAVIGLPQRLFWEMEFRGVGLFAFFVGMLLGAFALRWLRSDGIRLAASLALLFAGIAGHWFFIGLVERPAPVGYTFSGRQLLEFSVCALVYACWGIAAELAARTTILWRQ